MKILSIETSCDETAVSIIEASGGVEKPVFNVLSNIVLSQIKIHEKYGGVFPNLAKREHAKNLVPLIKKALEEAGLYRPKNAADFHVMSSESLVTAFTTDLSHETELAESFKEFFATTERPDIDLIAVTYGPGLEPALWVGINAAKVLHEVWNIPVLPVNHMEGHISSVLYEAKTSVAFPALALLISGGHTELVLVSDWLSYQIVGQTRDDAVGEAYDKVARMLGLPYPGGPQIASLATQARTEGVVPTFEFPRPMIQSHNLDFSFSGLKTAVLYKVRELQGLGGLKQSAPEQSIRDLSEEVKKEIACAFEDAVVDTLLAKVMHAISKYEPRALIIAGGVIANSTIRKAFERLTTEAAIEFLTPTKELSTDNALMIALAAYIRISKRPNEIRPVASIRAEGNVQLS